MTSVASHAQVSRARSSTLVGKPGTRDLWSMPGKRCQIPRMPPLLPQRLSSPQGGSWLCGLAVHTRGGLEYPPPPDIGLPPLAHLVSWSAGAWPPLQSFLSQQTNPAAEATTCYSLVQVSRPMVPSMLLQLASSPQGDRCTSLAVALLFTARQRSFAQAVKLASKSLPCFSERSRR